MSETDGRLPKDAEPIVRSANADVLNRLPFADRQDFEDAARGFIATRPDALVSRPDGHVVWNLKPYDFLQGDVPAPPTVNPSLWRQARLNLHHGLFEVVGGIYQVRGFDISNMTLVEGSTGVIVIDTLTAAEGARAALDLYFEHRGRRPVVAVIYTHTHMDHWGGVNGVLNEDDVRSGKIPVIAPDRFMEYAVTENVIAGNAMLRRAQYQFGHFLPKGERGHVDCGLGKDMPAGSIGLIAPTDLVKATGESRVIDGVRIEFQMAPDSEAPAEFHMIFPDFNTVNLAENATHCFHNLLPFRGAVVRDPLAWSKYLNEALELWGERSKVLIGQHHWPVWGSGRVKSYLETQRDLYKYVHDQTVHLMNQGLTAAEIAEQLELPETIARQWHARGYYGDIRHNAKAIYQRYLGWYDANPANLDPLPPVAAGKKYLEYMGGAAAALSRAHDDFRHGEYRWVAQVMSHVVFADPQNAEARNLLADAFEQLGYLAEAATWRNAYLFGAYELRHGVRQLPRRTALSGGTLKALGIEEYFDYLAVRLNGAQAAGKKIVVNWGFTDTGQNYALRLENCVLSYVTDKEATDADAAVSLGRPALDAIITGRTSFPAAIEAGQVSVAGNAGKLLELFTLFDDRNPMFEIVEPKKGDA
jgi:alkyl sulfatase BDS1-like metallo-beta-lactamase superfamily hydrolase